MVSTNIHPIMDKERQSQGNETAQVCNYCQGALDLLQEKAPWSQSKYEQTKVTNGWSFLHQGWLFPHYTSYEGVKRSAETGCFLCLQLCSGIDEDVELDPGMEQPGNICCRRDGTWSMQILPNMYGNPYGDQPRPLEVRLYPISNSLQNSERHGTLHSTEDGLPLAKIWLDTCRREHNLCHSPSTKGPRVLPTRLLDLSGTGLKLVSGIDLEISTEYATLSHCWGRIPFISLKKQSVGQFFTEILDDDLPRTFIDTIRVSRYLGLNYLWIDSLCIVQDDIDDWKKESALMASVYGNSTITIAASAAENSSVGCFFVRQSTSGLAYPLKANFEGQEQLYACNPAHMIVDQILRQQPLLKRGWVVQERTLSSRILYLTSTSLFWECSEMRVSEFLSDEECEDITGEEWDSDGSIFSPPRPPFTLQTWQKLVTLYSECKLTNGRDKLVALSGMAQASQLGDGQRYLAGLWEHDIERHLCWAMGGVWGVNKGRRYSSYRAPSWSWASLDGRVYFKDEERHRLLTKIHGIDIQPARSEEPYGEVQSATIRLFCACISFKDIYRLSLLNVEKTKKVDDEDDEDSYRDESSENDEDIYRNESSEDEYNGRRSISNYRGKDEEDENNINLEWAFDSRPVPVVYQIIERNCQLLPMLQRPVDSQPHWVKEKKARPFYQTFFLLLQPTGTSPGQYSRVGWAEVRHRLGDFDPGNPLLLDCSWAKADAYKEYFSEKIVDGKKFPGMIELV